MTDWQPIETAPKVQGEDILVGCVSEDGDYWTAVVSWWVEEWAFFSGRAKQYPHPLLLEFEPTHWMPLPEPPK